MRKQFRRSIGALLTCLFLTACSPRNLREQKTVGNPQSEMVSSTVFAMDTAMQLSICGSKEILCEAEELIAELDQALSTTDPRSDIYQINHRNTHSMRSSTEDVLKKALELCAQTDGALDITIYPIVRAWGFTTDSFHVPEEETLRELLPLIDYRSIRTDSAGNISLPENVEIDLGSVAKGYTGDRIAELLKTRGIEHAILNLGGNVHTVGTKQDGTLWQVALKDPTGDGYAGLLKIADKAVVTSGGYERFFEENNIRYHHILDPKTGYPVENGILSMTVVSDSGTVCDGLSTALFVMGQEESIRLWRACDDFEMIMILKDKILITEGLQDSFSPLCSFQDSDITVIFREQND